MKPLIRILHLEDDLADAELVQVRLGEAGLSVSIACVQERDEFETALRKGGTDIVLADYRLPKYDGMSALQLILQQYPEIPFVFVSGTMGEEAAIEALTQGATDYVLKDNLSRLPSAVQRALQEARNRRERRQAQKALQQSNDLLRAIIEAAPVAIIGLDLDGHVHLVWNPAAEKMLGWSAPDVMGRSLPTVPVNRQEKFKRLREQIQGGMSLEGVEVGLQRRDGTPIDCCIYASSLHDDQGSISGSIAVLVDITEQKQADEILRASEEALKLALDAAQMGQWDWNIVNGEIGWSRQCLALYGLQPDTPMSYERFLQALHPEDRERIDTALRRAVEDRTSYDEPKRTVWPDGSVHWTASRGQVYCDATGEPIRMTGVSFDITKWKEAEEALQKSHEELRAFFSQTIDACFFMMLDEPVHWDDTTDKEKVLDYVFAHQRITQINEAMLAQYGATREQMLNLTPSDFFQHNLAHGRDLWRQLFDTGKMSLESDERKLDGTPMWIEGEYIILYDSQGRITGHFGIQRDVTERKRMEEERQIHLWFLESMDQVNRAMQGTDKLEQMMRDVLDVVLSIFDCDRVFLMYPCDPESQTWTSPMESNKPEYPGVWDLNTEIPMDPQVAETLRILLAANEPVAFGPGTPHALPEDVSKQFDIKSFVSMAIYPKTGSPWQFGIHQCSYARIWTAEEKRLFQEIGRRLADALTSLLAYRRLQENEERYRLIAENTADTISVFDLNLKPIYTSPSVLKLRGYTVQEAMAQSLDQVLTPESLQKAEKVFAEQLALEASGKADPARTVLLELEEYCKDGSSIWVELAVSALRDKNLQPTGLLTVSRDIAERKRAEESIRKLSQAIEQSPVSIVITDLEGRIEFVNTRFTQITGYSYDEVLGQNPRILKSGETPAEEYQHLWNTISSGGVWRGEFHNRKKNGELYQESASISPIFDAGDTITHYVAVKEDITARKRLEAQFRQAQKMESVGRLAGGVAHDFNNMLGVIIGTTELLLDRVDPTRPLHADLQEIRKAAERSANLTRQLLAFARKQTVVPRVLDLNKILEGILRMLRRLIGEDIELAWLPGAGVWPVKVDPSQIDQILANLCVNARDAIAGVGKVVIETGNVTFDEAYCHDHPGFVSGEYVLLAVSDNGHGMHKETLDKIFEPFFTTKEMGKGTGLGLATVYGIVKQNEGFINAYSEPEHGTTFKIYLPRHAAVAERMGNEVPEVFDIRGEETILLVEDDPATLEVGKRMLERYGYRALAASTPAEAVRLAGEYAGEIRLLISDVIMPEMNGRDLAKKLNSFCPGLKHLFMSGYTGNVIAQHGVLDEGENFIQKPFSMQNLAAKVREVLDSKLGRDDLVRKPFREREILNAGEKHAGGGYILDESIEHGAKAGKTSSEEILTPEALAKLPDRLLADFKQAVIDLDLDRINDFIERIRELNAPVAQVMKELADDFQYDKLLTLIKI